MGQEYRRTTTTVSLINYHFVFCPRYRRLAFHQSIRHYGKSEGGNIKKTAAGIPTPAAFAQSVDSFLLLLYGWQCV